MEYVLFRTILIVTEQIQLLPNSSECLQNIFYESFWGKQLRVFIETLLNVWEHL